MHLHPRSNLSLVSHANFRQALAIRLFATHNRIRTSTSEFKDKSLTNLNSNDITSWSKLSKKGKILRATRQTFNLGLIMCGTVLSGGVAYLLYSEVFSSDSKTSHFNRSFDQIKKDPRCIAVLGDTETITAYGEGMGGSWRKARPFLSSIQTDKYGTQHLLLTYRVNGSKSSGVVYLHMIKRPTENTFTYKRLVLDVNGKSRIILKDSDATVSSAKKLKVFGVTWN
ncbi:Mitochondrial import inner membrane translocase subunit TIM21 [Erysiphe neolycopersici]|uniref:Mitochondrial import inner membrane translocase subunit Tim21 n=1 Tax=Erysiphe neolycopersici TaxID=212602 RepID=A0A420HLM0_9PEZI|nr:Mitochondrial import inner membrane translocase subunit TIM21 [Erysiphe neolycopersici]